MNTLETDTGRDIRSRADPAMEQALWPLQRSMQTAERRGNTHIATHTHTCQNAHGNKLDKCVTARFTISAPMPANGENDFGDGFRFLTTPNQIALALFALRRYGGVYTATGIVMSRQSPAVSR